MARLLLTNDDGVSSPGLQALAAALVERGQEVLVVAPRHDVTGAGSSIGNVRPGQLLELDVLLEESLPGIQLFGVDATPAMCVLAVLLGAFGEPPDVVVSGINAGPNLGNLIFHSGTVAAVLTGAHLGVSGVAVSASYGDPMRWDTAVQLGVEAVAWVRSAPPGTALNVNAPALAPDDVEGVRAAPLAPFGQLGVTRLDQALELSFVPPIDPPGTDRALVAKGFATITPIVGPLAAELDVGDLAASCDRSLRGRSPAG